ncbi:MAG: hypothetical protein RR530_09125 [Clostridium sp.]
MSIIQITIMFGLLMLGGYLSYKAWVAELRRLKAVKNISKLLYRGKYEFVIVQIIGLGFVSYWFGQEVLDKLSRIGEGMLFTYEGTIAMLPMYIMMLLWLSLVLKYIVGLKYPTIIHSGGIIFRGGNIIEFKDVSAINYMKAITGGGYNICVSTYSGAKLIVKVPEDDINGVLKIIREYTTAPIHQE